MAQVRASRAAGVSDAGAEDGAAKCGGMHVRVSGLTVEVVEPDDGGSARTVVDVALAVGRCRERPTSSRRVLDGVSGTIAPGSLTLVLGRPGCGKSTLLKALAGHRLGQGLVQAGSITYSGRTTAQMNVARSLAYVGQSDEHLPTLTVRETLEFASRCQPGPDTLGVDEVLSLLRLEDCADTIIGNTMLRGVSGGEKKRVTLGEMLVGPQVGWCMDEVSTGLDSATALEVFRALRARAVAKGHWIVAALLQPPPEVFELFDSVVVLDRGASVFFGPRDGLDAFMQGIGAEVPADADVADWVQFATLSGPEGRGRGDDDDDDDEELGLAGVLAHKQRLMYGSPETDSIPEWLHASLSAESLPWSTAVRLLIRRQFVLLVRNKPLFIGRCVQALGRALLVSSVFFNLAFDDFQSRAGLFLFSLMALAMGSLIAISIQVRHRSTLVKQQDSKFFPLSAYVLADMLSTTPLSALESIGFTSIMYNLCGLTESSDASFPVAIFLLFIFGVAMSEWIKFMASLAPDSSSAMPLAGVTVVLFIIHSGFVAIKDSIPDVWIWLYHASPLSWGMRGLAVNEFDSPEYRDTMYTLADGSVESAGQIYLSVYGFQGLTYSYVWTCAVVLACETGLFMLLNYLALGRVRFDEKSGTTPPRPGEEVADVELRDQSAKQAKAAGASLHFEGVSYWVNDDLQLLHGVSGACMPGTLTALMGASGAGKTTLLDVLAGRKTQGRVEGRVLVNGHPKVKAVFARAAAYVEQQDVHAPQDTVREAVAFSAALRGGDDGDVDRTLMILELDGLADRVVISLSVEQRKRLTIAIELVSNPAILFLDEPTSGLDARGAAVVMRVVRRVADAGKTVLCTIHQPSAAIAAHFDSLLLLQRGGRAAYFGDFAGVVPHLEGLTGVPPAAAGANPATYMLEVLQQQQDEVDFPAAWAAVAPPVPQPPAGEVLTASPPLGGVAAAAVVVGRLFRWYWRAPTYTLARLAFFVVVSVVFATAFTGSNYDEAPELMSRARLLFMSSMFVGFTCALMVQKVSFDRRNVWYRERNSGMYSPAAHALAGGLVELPYVVLLTLLFSIIFVPAAGFSLELERFLWFWLFLALNMHVSLASAQFFVEVTPNELTAQLGVILIITLNVLFSGVLKPSDSIPAGWKWMFHASSLNYVVEGLVTTQWHDDDTLVTSLLGVPTPAGELLQAEVYPEWEWEHRWRNVGLLLAYSALWRLGCYYGAFRVNKQVR